MRTEELRQSFASLGFNNATTYLQSGNVVFQCNLANMQELTLQTEMKVEQVFGHHAAVVLLEKQHLSKIVLSNPFLNQRYSDPSRLYVTFLSQPPSNAQWARLTPPKGITDEMAMSEGVIYLLCPSGYGKTRLSSTFFESKLGGLATTRTWNTVKALFHLAEKVKARMWAGKMG